MNTQPARGMRDILSVDARRRAYVINIIKDVYERYGFEPLETPAIENIETLTGKYGEEAGGLIFKILKRGREGEASGEADLALRYDLTVPLARVVAEYKDKLPKFFKRYQIQPVYRAERPGKNRFREFYQCDVDAINSISPVVETELISAACDVLERLGFTDFFIKLNHRGILTAVLNSAGVENNLHADALTAIDKLDKIGRAGVVQEMRERGVNDDASGRLLDLFDALANLDAEDFNLRALQRLIEFIGDDDAGAQSVDNLRCIIELSKSANVSRFIKIDASLARGLSYYTGAIMEASVPDLNSSIGGGGRYDNLIGMFGKEQIPACGFSLGLERILVVMQEREMFPAEVERDAAAQVLIAAWNEESFADSLALARQLRSAEIKVEVYPQADKLAKQFKYASSRGVPFVAVIGDEERANNKIALKNMEMGEQQIVARGQAANVIKRLTHD